MVRPTALWVAPVSNLAGVARHILDVARVGLPGWRLIVAAPEGPLLEKLREHGQAVLPVDIAPEVPTLTAVRNLREVVRSVRPALVHTHLARADLLAAMATVGLPVKLVSTEHHIPEDRAMFHPNPVERKAMEVIHHLRIRRVSALMAVSESTRRDMLSYWKPNKGVTVVRNGVDRVSNPVVREPGMRYLSLTRLSHEKNIEMTLRCFAAVHRQYPEARLTVGGSGPDSEALQSLAVRLGVKDAVAFPGFIDAVEAMATHDVLLQPSKSDNLSYTLLDAVAQGMGVAASPIGGNPEILPPHCIAPLDDDAAFTAVAIEQAQDVDRRPVLPPSIPAVEEMAAQVVAVYTTLKG
ncbi:MAG: glycosyltransferase family 4 protein [Propionibacteriaceae bacterium]|nr:glycosyltransferase family 4 protein [Propionibacteriaceae bacterium]